MLQPPLNESAPLNTADILSAVLRSPTFERLQKEYASAGTFKSPSLEMITKDLMAGVGSKGERRTD